MSKKLFAEFPAVSTEQWESVIVKDLKGADYNKRLIWKTLEGINVRPYYRAEDLAQLSHLSYAPGQFPYVRGTKTHNEWLIRQDYCAKESISEANKMALNAIRRGAQSIGFAVHGKDVPTGSALDQLLDGIDLEKIEINFTGSGKGSLQLVEALQTKAAKLNPEKVRLSVSFDPLAKYSIRGSVCDGLTENFRTLKETVALTTLPRFRTIGVNASIFNNAGGTAVQELAFGLAMGQEYIAQLTDAGLTIDQIAPRMKFTFAIGSNYFMEMAKFRAARMLWATLVSAYSHQSSCASKMKIHAVTSTWNKTTYDANTNMLRSTTEAMSAAIAGVDSLEVLPYDSFFQKTSDLSDRFARNTQLLLKEESYFNRVVDPAAGSYYIETLTDSIAKAAWALFLEIEDLGGYLVAFKAGEIQARIQATATRLDQSIATRRITLLGTNQFPNFNEKLAPEVLNGAAPCACQCTCQTTPEVEPLKLYRGAEAFEAVRKATELSGKQPKAFMLTFGSLAFARARAQFSCNFFACAGIQVIDNTKFASVEEGIEAALAAKADIVVACSSDEEYETAAPVIQAALGKQAIFVVAGDPACKETLISQGIKNFISVKSNVLETLKFYQQELGI